MKTVTSRFVIAALGLSLAVGVVHTAQAFVAKKEHKVAICHGTASDKNPYVLINVDISALKGHFDGTAPGHGKNHHPDFLAGAGGCTTSTEPGPGS